MSKQELRDATWTFLHAVAVNFPDGSAQGLTKEKLDAYYSFFESLSDVIPQADLRRSFRETVARGYKYELTKAKFCRTRSHLTLAKWLVGVHREIEGSNVSATQMYGKYAKFRDLPGAMHVNHGNGSTGSNGSAGISMLKDLLLRNKSAMDTFLLDKYGVAFRKLPRQADVRAAHIDEAARWFYQTISHELASSVKSWKSMTPTVKRDMIIASFQARFRRIRHIPGNTVRAIRNRLPSLR